MPPDPFQLAKLKLFHELDARKASPMFVLYKCFGPSKDASTFPRQGSFAARYAVFF